MRARVQGGWRTGISRAAFTLLELLVAIGIAAVLAGAILATIAGAIRVWERSRYVNDPSAEAALCLEKIEQELRNGFAFYGVAFEGAADRLQFPILMRASGQNASVPIRVGTVRYYRDGASRSLKREAWVYPGKGPGPAGAEKMISSLDKLKLSYYYASPEAGKGFGLADTWQDRNDWPLGVKIELSVKSGTQIIDVERSVYLPAAWQW